MRRLLALCSFLLFSLVLTFAMTTNSPETAKIGPLEKGLIPSYAICSAKFTGGLDPVAKGFNLFGLMPENYQYEPNQQAIGKKKRPLGTRPVHIHFSRFAHFRHGSTRPHQA